MSFRDTRKRISWTKSLPTQAYFRLSLLFRAKTSDNQKYVYVRRLLNYKIGIKTTFNILFSIDDYKSKVLRKKCKAFEPKQLLKTRTPGMHMLFLWIWSSGTLLPFSTNPKLSFKLKEINRIINSAHRYKYPVWQALKGRNEKREARSLFSLPPRELESPQPLPSPLPLSTPATQASKQKASKRSFDPTL